MLKRHSNLQTGEQMMHMAQGAVDTVKNTLGFNDDKSN